MRNSKRTMRIGKNPAFDILFSIHSTRTAHACNVEENRRPDNAILVSKFCLVSHLRACETAVQSLYTLLIGTHTAKSTFKLYMYYTIYFAAAECITRTHVYCMIYIIYIIYIYGIICQ